MGLRSIGLVWENSSVCSEALQVSIAVATGVYGCLKLGCVQQSDCLRLPGVAGDLNCNNDVRRLCIQSDDQYHFTGDALCHCMNTSVITAATVSKSCVAFTTMTMTSGVRVADVTELAV